MSTSSSVTSGTVTTTDIEILRSQAEGYKKRIQALQEEYLIPLKEDLADWINRILGKEDLLTAENFIDKLDNGVLICHVAKIIEAKCDYFNSPPPSITTVSVNSLSSFSSHADHQTAKIDNGNQAAVTTTITTIEGTKTTSASSTASTSPGVINNHQHALMTPPTPAPRSINNNNNNSITGNGISCHVLSSPTSLSPPLSSLSPTSSTSSSLASTPITSTSTPQEWTGVKQDAASRLPIRSNDHHNKGRNGSIGPRSRRHSLTSSTPISSRIPLPSSSRSSMNGLRGGLLMKSIPWRKSSFDIRPSPLEESVKNEHQANNKTNKTMHQERTNGNSNGICPLQKSSKSQSFSDHINGTRTFVNHNSAYSWNKNNSNNCNNNYHNKGNNTLNTCNAGNNTSLNHNGSFNDNKRSINKNSSVTPFRISSVKCWENAKSASFFARDNVCNFITWCRFLNVREACLFESEDLVLHNNQKNVVLCLLEVARIVCKKYSFPLVPGLVVLEKEIEKEEEAEMIKIKQLQSSKNTLNHLRSVGVGGDDERFIRTSSVGTSPDSPNVRKVHTQVQTCGDERDLGHHHQQHLLHNLITPPRSVSPSCSIFSTTGVSESSTNTDNCHMSTSTGGSASPVVTSQLDQKVMLIAKSFYGKKAKEGIQRLEEGKYRIAGKIVFVRLLRDRHVMVRVGGGWDTLQHFLERHGMEEEASQAAHISPSDLLPMDTRPSETKRRSHNRSLGSAGKTVSSRSSLFFSP